MNSSEKESRELIYTVKRTRGAWSDYAEHEDLFEDSLEKGLINEINRRNVFVVASNGRYNVLKKGELYTVLKVGESMTSVKKWKDRRLLSSMLIKGGYDLIDPPEPY